MTTKTRIEAVQHRKMYQPPIGRPCWHGVDDAARAMDVSEEDVIAAVSDQTDVRTIEGPSVAGMIEIQCGHSETGYLPYYD